MATGPGPYADATPAPSGSGNRAVRLATAAWLAGLIITAAGWTALVFGHVNDLTGQVYFAGLGLWAIAGLLSVVAAAVAPSGCVPATIAALSSPLYLISLFTPAISIDGREIPGWGALWLGAVTVLGGSWPWLANPLYGLSVLAIAAARYRAAVVIGISALVLASSSLVADFGAYSVTPLIGFVLWLVALASPVVAGIIGLRARSSSLAVG